VSNEKKSLATKLAKIYEAVGYVQKTGTNAAQGYKYVQAAEVAATVREQLSKLNVIMTPTNIDVVSEGQTPSGKQVLLTLRFTWTLTDGDTGETITWQSVGTGSDATDKAAYKAATGALKYALLTGFLIPTGDDPENDSQIMDAAKKIFEAKPAAKAEPSSLEALDF